MTVSIVNQNSDSFTLKVTVPFNRSMLDSENLIQEILNKVGRVATVELLKTFDTEGEDIVLGAVKMTSKGLTNKCYQTPYGEIEIERHIYQAAVGIGLDGTCMLMCENGYRQAMVSTIALYDSDGERQHTTYVAAAPEYGKEKFKDRLTREIERAKALYPSAIKIGIADGAHDNWEFLEKHTDKQTLDFYHATEYLTDVASGISSTL